MFINDLLETQIRATEVIHKDTDIILRDVGQINYINHCKQTCVRSLEYIHCLKYLYWHVNRYISSECNMSRPVSENHLKHAQCKETFQYDTLPCTCTLF